MAAALQTFLALQQRCCATEKLERLGQRDTLEFARFQQGRQTRNQSTVFQEELIGQ